MAREGAIHPSRGALVGNDERTSVLAFMRPAAGIPSDVCQTVTRPLTWSIRRQSRMTAPRDQSLLDSLLVSLTEQRPRSPHPPASTPRERVRENSGGSRWDCRGNPIETRRKRPFRGCPCGRGEAATQEAEDRLRRSRGPLAWGARRRLPPSSPPRNKPLPDHQW